MKLTSFHTVGSRHNAPSLFLEADRFNSIGFTPGATFCARPGAAPYSVELTLTTPAIPLPGRHLTVSRRRAAGSYRPVIDLNSTAVLGALAGHEEARVTGSHGIIRICPSIRAANILTGKTGRSTYRVLDVFCGGGTASDAFTNPRFNVVAGIEIEPDYADEWARKHPNGEIIMGDLRHMHPTELPEFDGIFAGIPCTSHSDQGRTKNQLAGKPELGETGDLFIPVLGLIAYRLPSFVVLENVPSFGTSLAGETIKSHLSKLGYGITETIINPWADFAEPSDRRRWICVATLRTGFEIPNPHTPFTGTLNDYLDPVNTERDQADVARIAVTLAGLRKHAERHAALGHGFRVNILARSAMSSPTLLKSYYKINASGAFVATEHGARMIRPEEFARIHGHTFTSTHAATIYQMSGQGVQTLVFRTILDALASFLP